MKSGRSGLHPKTRVAMLYDRPGTLDDALALLARGPRTLLAGGTDLYPATGEQALDGALLDLAGMPGLAGIARTREGLRIGACTTWSEVREAALPPACDALRAAAAEVGGRQIQNAGTVGGNLCNASPAADGIPVLMALDAEVVLRSGEGERRCAVVDFVRGSAAYRLDATRTLLRRALHELAAMP
jgi:CO/xanthine dehydrogenase FAD-binding subunit